MSKETNKKHIIVAAFIVMVIIAFYISAVMYQTHKYPAPTLESVNIDTDIICGEYVYKATEAGFVSDENEGKLWQEEIEEFGDVRVVYVKLMYERIVEKTDASRITQLGDYTLVTDTYNQAPDLVRYMNFNSIEEQSKSTDSVGDSKEICIVFTIPKVQFTEKQWEKMKIEDFKLHISRYPVIKEIKL